MNYESITFKGLIPLNEYNGIVLKLTKKDKAEIVRLQKLISEYEVDSYENNRHKSLKKSWTEKDRNSHFWRGVKNSEIIKILRENIAEIKRNRFLNQQKNINTRLKEAD